MCQHPLCCVPIGVNGELLTTLTDEELAGDLGITSGLQRRKILADVAKLTKT